MPNRTASRRPLLGDSADGTAIDGLGAAALFGRDEQVFRAGGLADHLYKVESGCVRTFAKVRDRGRVDLAFYYPGDYFGIEARDKHALTAEAVIASQILTIPKTQLAARVERDLASAQHLLAITHCELQRSQSLRLLLHNSADRRVAEFLFDLRKRNGRKSVELPMSRRDIADHLNLTIESVSRALTQLHNKSVISLESQRRVRVHSRHH